MNLTASNTTNIVDDRQDQVLEYSMKSLIHITKQKKSG